MKSFGMDMELFYLPKSRSDRASWTIHELGIADQVSLKKLNVLKGEQNDSDFKAKNPMGQVPTLILACPKTGKKHVMTESAAIAQFLVESTESDLQPKPCNTLARAQYFRVASLAATSIDTMVYTVLLNELLLPAEKRDMKAAAKARVDFVEKPLKTLESIFAVEEGEEPVEYICEPFHKGFTAADIILGQILSHADDLDMLATSPVVKAYVSRLRERPAFKNMHA
eukprot:IDg943t1